MLLESRSILGGRARSWTDGVTRDPVHIGPHVVVSEYPNFFKLLEELGTREKTLELSLNVFVYHWYIIGACMVITAGIYGYSIGGNDPDGSFCGHVDPNLRIVWQPWRHFVTMVKGRQEHHIRTMPLPAPASWGHASMTDPFVSWADKHSTVPAAVYCLSLSEKELLELDA